MPGVDIEILSWVVRVETPRYRPPEAAPAVAASAPPAPATRRVFDPACGAWIEAGIYRRASLDRGAELAGPAVVVEDDTSTVVPPGYRARITAEGYIELTAEASPS